MEHTFKFDLHQKVKTIMGTQGVITHCGLDSGGGHYLVGHSTDAGVKTTWHRESELTAIGE